MGDIDKQFQWHSKYFSHQNADNQTVLLSERDAFILHGEQVRLVNAFLGSSEKLSTFAMKIDDSLKEARLYYAVNQMLKSNYIETLSQDSNDKNYCQPDYKLEPNFIRLMDGNIELTVLSQHDEIDLFVDLVSTLVINKSLTIVVTDDYLDPRLHFINKKLRARQRPWLLLKVTGERQLIGPYFDHRQKQACWQCLSTLMLSNQPVRKWLQNKTNEPIAIPVLYDRSKILDVMERVRVVIQGFLDTHGNNHLTEIDIYSDSTHAHPIHRLANCVSCGDPNQFSNQVSRPILLQSRDKVINQQTGSRSVPVDDTYNLSVNHISPVSGFIQELRELPEQAGQRIKIYRSSFPKTPYNATDINSDVFTQVSLGKGINAIQTKVSALCESFERTFAQYQGDEPKILSAASSLPYRRYVPQELNSFSEQQYGRMSIKRYEHNFSLYWLHTWSLTNKEYVYLPFTYCFANTPLVDEQYCQWNSNGCAAGNNIEEAILQGFFELVERDAAAIWWYNKTVRPEIDLNLLENDQLKFIQKTLCSEWNFWALDLTHDFNIPVVAAVGRHKDTGKFVLGFGCHLNISTACVRALTELCQLIPIRYENSSPFDFDSIKEEPFLLPKGGAQVTQIPKTDYSDRNDIKDDIEFCVAKAKSLGLETLVLNYTRFEFAIKTVKVVIPGMCHIWPQFANSRLYSVPVEMGWRQYANQEESLNCQSLLI